MRAARKAMVRAVVGGLVLIALVATPAAARPTPPNPDSGGPEATAGAGDLAGISADRWIVQLAEPASASYQGGVGSLAPTSPSATGRAHFDTAASATQSYEAHLRASQQSFESRLTTAVPGARVERRYQTVLNGMAVKMSTADAAKVRTLAGVRAVTPDATYHLDMFSTPAQIGAPTLWNDVGGQANAGAGVKVAVIDTGIFVSRTAKGKYNGNACFDDAGYSLPATGGYPLGDTRFTNNKVIAARSYFRQDDPPVRGEDTPIPGAAGDSHGTHVSGTIACNANTPITFQGINLNISGIAPHAWLMNYKVFYTSKTKEDFQNGNAYVAELVQAIDDAVRDGADVISNSWGATYTNTLAWPDPMVQAAESASDAGVTMVFANGNEGPDTATSNPPANSSKVIGVGASTKDTTISTGFVDVTGPGTPPPELTNRDVDPGEFGPEPPDLFGPAPYVPAENVATNSANDGCSLGDDSNPFPAGSLTGKIALISRGGCEFSDKVANAQGGGAIGAFVYNSAANGDNLQTMGAGARADEVTIPSWFLRRSDGLGMVAFANANPGATAQFRASPHAATNIGDVMAGFSSRGPTKDKTLKPDLVAPGVDIVSSGYGSGTGTDVFRGFGSVSGTSMATPHVAGSAALLKQLHPNWSPGQVKSALMSTATEDVWLDTAQTDPATVLDRGAGRIDLTKAGHPGLTFDSPSVSAGEVPVSTKVKRTINATNVAGTSDTWDITTTADPHLVITLDKTSFTLADGASTAFAVTSRASSNAEPGDYGGDVVLTSRGTGLAVHVPVWLRVISTTPVADVLLVDDDGSGFGAGADYSAFYQNLFTSLGVSYQYVDIDADFFPTRDELFGYKAVVMFTGDNASFDTSGMFTSDQNALMEWLDSGGRLWMTGQNLAEETDSNTDFDSAKIGRSRLYHGYLGLRFDMANIYPTGPPRPTADGGGFLSTMHIDLSPGADGAGNQSSIEGTTPLGDTDTYNAANTMVKLFSPRSSRSPQSGIGYSRSSDPSLEESRYQFLYRSVSFGFGLEGVNSTTGQTPPADVAARTLAWLLDTVGITSIKQAPGPGGAKHLTVAATSSKGSVVAYRWDFGDGSPYQTTTSPSVDHVFLTSGSHIVRVEATDDLGHRVVGSKTFN